MDLNHVIVAMKGEKIAKVQCLTCKKEHAYRIPKGEKTPKAPKQKKNTSSDEGNHSIEVEWEKLMNAHRDVPVKPYSMKAHFSLGDKIHHPTFGDGIIAKLIYPNKLEVIFRTDVKILIYGGAAV